MSRSDVVIDMSESSEHVSPEKPTDGGNTSDQTPEAPYGFKADGTPRKRPGRRPGSSGTRPRATASRKTSSGYYKKIAGGCIQAVAGMPAVISRFVRKQELKEALVLDSYTMAIYAEPLSIAAEQWALNDARFAAAMERVARVAPAGPILTVVVPFLFQISVNHGLLPAFPELNVKSREQLLAELDAQSQRQAA